MSRPMRHTKYAVFGLGLVWEGISVMLPPWAAIPFILVGLVMVGWAIWPVRVNRVFQRMPSPVQKYFFGAIKWAESKLDESSTQFVIDGSKKSEATFIKFFPTGAIIDGSNISSVTDCGTGDYIIAFVEPLNPKTLVVHAVGKTPRSFQVEHVSADGVSVLFEKEPEIIELRFDD